MDKWSEIPSSCKSLGKKLCKVNENMPNMVCADHSVFFVSWLIGCGKHEAIEIHKVGYLETKHSSHKASQLSFFWKKWRIWTRLKKLFKNTCAVQKQSFRTSYRLTHHTMQKGPHSYRWPCFTRCCRYVKRDPWCKPAANQLGEKIPISKDTIWRRVGRIQDVSEDKVAEVMHSN